jgi:hypothetical protein
LDGKKSMEQRIWVSGFNPKATNTRLLLHTKRDGLPEYDTPLAMKFETLGWTRPVIYLNVIVHF